MFEPNTSNRAQEIVREMESEIAARVERYQKHEITLELNEWLALMSDCEMDRDAAFRALSVVLGVRSSRELSLHGPDNLSICQCVGFPDAKLEELQTAARAEIEYLDSVFKGNIPPMLLKGGWCT